MFSLAKIGIRASLGFAAAACLVGPLAAQVAPAPSAFAAESESRPLESGEGRLVALKLADELVSSFVLRDQAEAYAAMLKSNAAAGRYDKGTRGELSKLMTDDLMAVHKDGHLHVMVDSG